MYDGTSWKVFEDIFDLAVEFWSVSLEKLNSLDGVSQLLRSGSTRQSDRHVLVVEAPGHSELRASDSFGFGQIVEFAHLFEIVAFVATGSHLFETFFEVQVVSAVAALSRLPGEILVAEETASQR